MIFFLFLELQQDTTVNDTFDVVRYEAQRIVYDLDKSLIILYDSTHIVYQDIKLWADSTYYYVDNNELVAFGNCDLRQMDDSISGNYLRYNIGNRKALMTEGKTQIENGFVEGKEIYWVDENTVNCYDGIYTTCNDSPPHYYFYSPKMKVYLGDMVIARPIVLYIQGVPVMAAPFWFVPISSKRKSGLLPFRVGNSRTFGKFIRDFAYYLVISDYADVTIQVDAMEKKGIMPNLEVLWDFSPFSKGSLYGSYIKESDTGRKRYSIEGRNNSEYFLFGSTFNCDIKYVSDNNYKQSYAETTLLWLEKEITSQATLSRDIAGFKNSLIYERRENFVDTVTSTIQERAPSYTITSPSQTLFSLISYSLAGRMIRDRRQTLRDTSEVIGGNIRTSPAMQQNVAGLFTISPRVDLDLAGFDEDTLGNKNQLRFGYSFGATASTNLFRVFNIELLGVHGVLHKITPSIVYNYTPDFDFGRFPSISGIPQFSKRHTVSFGLDQDFEAKMGEERARIAIARVGLNSGYSFITDSLSSIGFLVNLPYNPFPKPITAFSTQIDGSIDPYTREYGYRISNTTSIKTDFFSLNINNSYIKGGVYQVWFNGDVKPTRNWKISYAARYDWETKKLVDYSFGLNRDLHCWEAFFSFNQLGDTWRYDFKVRIKAIPEVAIGRGLLGYILE
jgi:hypothetical protein